VSILYRFRDIAGYLWRVANFDPPHMHLVPPWGVTPVEFRGDLWHQKTRVAGLSCGVACVILRLAVLVEHRLVTDRRTFCYILENFATRPYASLHLAPDR